MLEIYNSLAQGGIVMIPLAICSILALAIIIEKFIVYKKSKIFNPEIISVVDNIASPEDIPLAVSVCSNYHGPFSHLIKIILENYHQPLEDIKEDVADQARQEIRILERGLGILETVAAIAPILGLLGTVLGMVRVFADISTQGVGDPALLSGGISEALISTAVGLSIGIPTLVFYNYFYQRSNNVILELEKISNELIRKIRSYKQET
ncbi:MAG: MotA/TolQ/ExbB proton channel family protein [Candidatus Cloacimonetes bacterium]|nr:MotA/TolQ/ExbB proton channel family protein [Candidatus Cloacimonadota bacterium]